MTPEQRAANIAKLVSAARAMLSGQVGVAVGTLRISKLLGWLGPEVGSDFPQFARFIDQFPAGVPIANERLHWETDALLTIDKQLAAIESKLRAELMSACAQVIKTYG